MLAWRTKISQHDSNEIASGKPGAVQNRNGITPVAQQKSGVYLGNAGLDTEPGSGCTLAP